MQFQNVLLGVQLWPIVTCRSAATEHVDDSMLRIGIPAQPPPSPAGSSEPRQQLYFGTLEPLSAHSGLSSGHSSSTLDPMTAVPPIEGVQLGPLLGKGSFGSVHYGTWNGKAVAVKVTLPLFCK